MTMKPKVIAILCADIHLSHKPPIWRSNEPDWYAAMQRPLDEISNLRLKHQCSILCAGDIFDKWNSCPELINFAIKKLPSRLYCVAGQHDLPNHNLKEIEKSAFFTLSYTGHMRLLVDGYDMYPNYMLYEVKSNKVDVRGCSYGESLLGHAPNKRNLKVAIVHDYVWYGKAKYPNAPKEKEIQRMGNHHKFINDKYYGYDVIVYGDNHLGFTHKIGKTTIFNCGTLMRRKSDEVDYKPQVGLLYSDGSVKPHYLDISKDKHLTADEAKDAEALEEVDMVMFAEELRKLGSSALDFSESMKQFWTKNKTPQKVKDIILKAMVMK